MKPLIGAVLLLVFTVSSCCAAEPVFEAGSLSAGEIGMLECFTIWLYSEDDWELEIGGSERFKHRLQGNERWLEHWEALSGSGGGESLLYWEIGFDADWISPGIYKLPMELELRGAAGVLRASRKTGYWIMPLNTDDVRVRKRDEMVFVPNYTWELVDDGDQVYYGSQLLFDVVHPSDRRSLDRDAEWAQVGLRWEPNSLSLEAGEKKDVTLIMEGPIPKGEVVIQASSYVEFHDVWYLNGTEIPVERLGHHLLLSIPELPRGTHRLWGAVYGLLTSKEQDEQIVAWYGSYETTLTVRLKRTWFDRSGQLQLRVREEKKPASYMPFLLPNGEIRFTNEEGILWISLDPGLHAIYCLKDPENPLWVVIHPNTIQTMTINLRSHRELSAFLIPSLQWGEQKHWRIVGQKGAWSWDIGSERWRIDGYIGDLHVQGDGEGIGLWYQSPSLFENAGSWQWRQSARGYEGLWTQSGWVVSLAVPWQKDTVAAHLSYYGNGWHMRLDPHSFRMSCTRPHWAVGVAVHEKMFWTEVFDRRMRFELHSRRMNVSWSALNGQWYLDYVPPNNVRVEWTDELYEIVAETTDRERRLGLRLNIPYAWRKLQLSTGTALLLGNDGLVGELNQRVMWDISPHVQLYAVGAVQYTCLENQRRSLCCDYELGVHMTPRAAISGTLAWERASGWKWQIGVAVPFTGRK